MNNENSKTIETEIATQDAGSNGQDGNAPLSVNASGVPEKKAHDRPPDMVRKIGKTTYKSLFSILPTGLRCGMISKTKRGMSDEEKLSVV